MGYAAIEKVQINAFKLKAHAWNVSLDRDAGYYVLCFGNC
jgi:hypothetical protein